MRDQSTQFQLQLTIVKLKKQYPSITRPPPPRGVRIKHKQHRYCTTVPDVMSMSACLWARLPKVVCGVTQEFALRYGHEEGWLHFHELMTADEGLRNIPTERNCARSECEDVFKFWSSLNGTIY